MNVPTACANVVRCGGLLMLAGLLPSGVLASGPDLIVGDLTGPLKWGTLDGVSGYSVSVSVCNIGDQPATVQATTPQHPLYSYNMYRLHDGRFEQIAIGWVRHEFCVLQQALCTSCTPAPGTCDQLGAGCSSTSSSSTMGMQQYLGPRSEVNPLEGGFPMPYTTQGQTGDVLYKRMQTPLSDLNPSLNPGALYFVEGLVIAPDEAQAGHGLNNASYRRFVVGSMSGSPPGYELIVSGAIVRQAPAIFAWAAADPSVRITPIDVPGDGRFFLGARATELPGGLWSYEYALYNLNAQRAAGSFHVPAPGAELSAAGFRDIDYHSGEPYDGADWSIDSGSGGVRWATTPFSVNPQANALRWGTLYNFRFVADQPPAEGRASIGLFLPAAPNEVQAITLVPTPSFAAGDLNCDGAVNFDDIPGFTLALIDAGAYAASYPDCQRELADVNGDGRVDFDDIEAFVLALVAG